MYLQSDMIDLSGQQNWDTIDITKTVLHKTGILLTFGVQHLLADTGACNLANSTLSLSCTMNEVIVLSLANDLLGVALHKLQGQNLIDMRVDSLYDKVALMLSSGSWRSLWCTRSLLSQLQRCCESSATVDSWQPQLLKEKWAGLWPLESRSRSTVRLARFDRNTPRPSRCSLSPTETPEYITDPAFEMTDPQKYCLSQQLQAPVYSAEDSQHLCNWLYQEWSPWWSPHSPQGYFIRQALMSIRFCPCNLCSATPNPVNHLLKTVL